MDDVYVGAAFMNTETGTAAHHEAVVVSVITLITAFSVSVFLFFLGFVPFQQHLDCVGTHGRVLFMDVLHSKLIQLSGPASTCQKITNSVTDRKQQVRLGRI